MSVALHHGDCLKEIPKLRDAGVIVDSVVCDPPYHLIPTVKRFGKSNSAPAQHGRDGAMARLSAGFMNSTWDGGDIAFRPSTWETVSSVMKPGAFLLAFGGTRTYHRLACAIEDGGFVIQDCLMWLFATGFPKNKSQMKPSFEPIVMAYKPGGKRELSIDECRIATNGEDMGDPHRFAKSREHEGWTRPSHTPEHIAERGDRAISAAATIGRWPANICLEDCDAVVGLFPQSAGGNYPTAQRKHDASSYSFASGKIAPAREMGDSGSAARFFFSAKAGPLDRWMTTRQEIVISWNSEVGQCQVRLLVATALSPARVIAASESGAEHEWNTFLFGSGLTDLFRRASRSTIKMTTNSIMESQTWNWLTRSLTSDFTPDVTCETGIGSSPVDHAGSIRASISFILAETASMPNASHALSGGLLTIDVEEKRVGHPTVKPISLMRWLVKLVTPPNGIILDPFAGTGTTGLAAIAERRNAILIERELSYIADIRERLAFYEGGGTHSVQAKNRNRAIDHGPLFESEAAL